MDITQTPTMPFEDWFKEVDTLCQRHLLCTWHDLCGDPSDKWSTWTLGTTRSRG